MRFAFSGKLAILKKQPGDTVRKGELLAGLDKTLLQAELDRQLADYEKRRAEFDIAAKMPPKNKDDDLNKFARSIEQAQLNVSVKDVELAKGKLDLADLLSPVDGTVLDIGGCTVGVNVSPSANAITVVESATTVFRIAVDQESIGQLTRERRMEVSIPGAGKQMSGLTKLPVPGMVTNSHPVLFLIDIRLENSGGLLPGMSGDARFAD